jgi:hypothetical protein
MDEWLGKIIAKFGGGIILGLFFVVFFFRILEENFNKMTTLMNREKDECNGEET